VGGDGAERRREETCTEFEKCALRLGDEAAGKDCRERELVAELLVELGVELMCGLAGEDGVRGEAAAVQRECEAIAGEGRDDRSLVTDCPEVFSDGVAAEKTVGDGADSERAREKRLGLSETSAEVRCFVEQCGECVPATAGVAEELALDDEAEIGSVGFDEREATVPAGDEEELDGVAEFGELVGRETEIHLETDEICVRAKQRAWEAAEIVLAGGENDMWRGECIGVIGACDMDAPEIVVAMQGFGDVAAEDESVSGCGAFEESFVECAARERLRGEREGCRGDAE